MCGTLRNRFKKGVKSELITVNGNRSVYVPESDRHIGFENDNLVEQRLFEICDASLFGFSFKLDIENTMDVVDLVPFAETENSRIYSWDITSGAIGKGGIIKTQIRAFDASGERVWHSEWIDFVANESINATKKLDDERIITEFEQLETRVQTAVNTTEASAQNAELSAEEASLSAQSSEKYALEAQQSAEIASLVAKDVNSAVQQAQNYASDAKVYAEASERHSLEAKTAAESINKIIVDATLDENSSNPVENKAVSGAISKINEDIGSIDEALDMIIALQESYV